MINLDKIYFGKIVAEALTDVAANCSTNPFKMKRWVSAIAKAAAFIENDTTFIHFDVDTKSLLIFSNSNEIYNVNTVCQCKAFQLKQPCYHRAMFKLVKNYYEFQVRPNSQNFRAQARNN